MRNEPDAAVPFHAPPTRPRHALRVLPPVMTKPPPKHRGRTESAKRLSQRELHIGAAKNSPAINAACPRPRTVADCEADALGTPENPCPFCRCKYHLFVDVQYNGSILYPYGAVDLANGIASGEIASTCALREADRGPLTLEEVATRMNLTRERVRQIEARALAKVEHTARAMGMDNVDLWTLDGRVGAEGSMPAQTGLPTRDEVTAGMKRAGVPPGQPCNEQFFVAAVAQRRADAKRGL